MWCCLLKRNNRTMQCDSYRSRVEQATQAACSTGKCCSGLTASWDGRFRISPLGERAAVLALLVAVRFLMQIVSSTDMSMQCSTATPASHGRGLLLAHELRLG